MNVSDFVIDATFTEIWSFWLNKEKGEHAPRKAVSVVLRSGHDKKRVIEACRIYTLLHEGDEVQYVKQLNNFLMGDEWMDILDHHSAEALEKQRLEAVALIEEWNKVCRNHWCKVEGIDSRVPIAKRALMNSDFKKNWKKALDKACQIFYYVLNEKDSRSKIILSFSWFTNVSPNKHTVIKIIEGEYGKPQKETRYKPVEINPNPVSLEERKELAEYFKELRHGKRTKDGGDLEASKKPSTRSDPYGFS